MCTVVGLAILIGAVTLLLAFGYLFFITMLEGESDKDMPWHGKALLGGVVILALVAICLFLLSLACYGLYCVAPAVGCYVMRH